MSHNSNDVGRSARRHRPALIAIVVALLAAVGAYLVFPVGIEEENSGIITTAPPADTPVTDAEGRDGDDQPTVSPVLDRDVSGTQPDVEPEDAPAAEPVTPQPAN